MKAKRTPFLAARRAAPLAARDGAVRRPVAAGVVGVGVVAGALLLTTAGVDAKPLPDGGEASASNGGVATAETVSTIVTGDIVTGNNSGHSVETGGTGYGDIDVAVGDMSSAADLAVGTTIGPQVADAGGGDAGKAVVEAPEGAETGDIKVDISSEANVDSDSSATGIGIGGAGGAGGSGGGSGTTGSANSGT